MAARVAERWWQSWKRPAVIIAILLAAVIIVSAGALSGWFLIGDGRLF